MPKGRLAARLALSLAVLGSALPAAHADDLVGLLLRAPLPYGRISSGGFRGAALPLEPDCSVFWKSEPLGSDGVVVTQIVPAIIRGEGDWDPPGGWRPFTVLAANGQLLPEQAPARSE
jgi:hypothetical protein